MERQSHEMYAETPVFRLHDHPELLTQENLRRLKPYIPSETMVRMSSKISNSNAYREPVPNYPFVSLINQVAEEAYAHDAKEGKTIILKKLRVISL